MIQVDTMETKVCTRCNIEKSPVDFYYRKDQNSYRKVCKKCCTKQCVENNRRPEVKERRKIKSKTPEYLEWQKKAQAKYRKGESYKLNREKNKEKHREYYRERHYTEGRRQWLDEYNKKEEVKKRNEGRSKRYRDANVDKFRELEKANMKKAVIDLDDKYIKHRLRASAKGSSNIVTNELIETQRQIIKLKRAIKNDKK